MNTRPLTILIAGGGTGGHLFPGIAVAKTFRKLDNRNAVLFVGTDRPLEKSVLCREGFRHKSITAQGIKGMGFRQKTAAILKLPLGLIESALVLNRFRPDIVIGLGGYSSGPVILTARFLGIKTALLEQNVLPGITNRLLGFFADRIYVAFKNTRFQVPSTKIRIMGNPVRNEIAACRMRRRRKNDVTGKKPFRILIAGGSQGAHSINRTVIDALNYLENINRYRFVHQTGVTDENQVSAAYDRMHADYDVRPFFNDMAALYDDSDLIICRAGATTIAEITAAGKAALLIPYPFAADNHQVLNARALTETNAAEMIEEKDLNAEHLARRIEFYATHPKVLSETASQARALGQPGAAEAIVNDCYRMISAAPKIDTQP